MKKSNINFHVITAFPESFSSYLSNSLLAKAIQKKLIKVDLVNLRDFSEDKHRSIDDRPFGGGPGMVLAVGPIWRAVEKTRKKIRRPRKERTILLSLKGKKFDQKKAAALAKMDDLILICGHYEGVDERVAKQVADEEISLGDFVLSGGELGALILIETIGRLRPGFLGNEESIEEKRFLKEKWGLASFPAYTRPEIFYPDKKNKRKKWTAPKVLLSGNHREIEEWRRKNLKIIGK